MSRPLLALLATATLALLAWHLVTPTPARPLPLVAPQETPGGPARGCHTLAACRAELARARAAVRWQQHERRAALRHRWATARPTLVEAAQIAGKVYGVDAGAMVRVSRCEISDAWRPHLRRAPFRNRRSGAYGPWQFLASTWSHTPWAGWDPANVYVAALATAQIVRADGCWCQWSCGWAA